MLYVLGAIKSEMPCAPGMAQTATCELQIHLYINHQSSILHIFMCMEYNCHDSSAPFTLFYVQN